jgi:hypothetical protein
VRASKDLESVRPYHYRRREIAKIKEVRKVMILCLVMEV